jgi:catechol 2,3-dioxygenase-like lactoylglutathione lyase family enzyme
MRYKMSGNLLLRHDRFREAAEFYRDVMGLEPFEEADDRVGLKAGDTVLYVKEHKIPGQVFEFLVPDLDVAHAELRAAGCEVLLWEGRGGSNYVRDPFGFVFNVWEDPGAFE